MGAVHRMILEPGCGVLPPDHQGIVGVVDRVGAEATQDRVSSSGPGVPMASTTDAFCLPVARLMTSYTSWSTRPASSTGRGVVQSLQALRHGWRDGEAGAAAGNGHVVVVELHPGLQVGVELDHADGDPERQTRLPLISGHYHYLGTLSPRQQPIQGEDGRQAGFALPAGSIQPASRG